MKSVVINTNEYSLSPVLSVAAAAWNVLAFPGYGELTFLFPDRAAAEAVSSLLPEVSAGVGCQGDIVVAPGLLSPKGALRLLQGGDPGEGFLPVSSAAELNRAKTAARSWVAAALTDMGVDIMAPDGVHISPLAVIGRGTAVLPGTVIAGRTVIGENCVIGPNAYIKNCVIADNVTVNASDLNESSIGSGSEVGPFAYVRPGCTVGCGTKIGDFVEIKNSVIGDDAKLSHLTYVGDSDIGRNVNMGCGTVVVNYDGKAKTRTKVGDNAFVGCNVNLISPVNVGDRAYIAAGTTVTDDVPQDALAIGRARQETKPGRAQGRFSKVKDYEK